MRYLLLPEEAELEERAVTVLLIGEWLLKQQHNK
jgi:hypothetical protein